MRGLAWAVAEIIVVKINLSPFSLFLIDRQSGELHILGTAKPLESYLDDYIKKSVKLG